jgi:hypothetical protein
MGTSCAQHKGHVSTRPSVPSFAHMHAWKCGRVAAWPCCLPACVCVACMRVACMRACGLHACVRPACVRVACMRVCGLHACVWPACVLRARGVEGSVLRGAVGEYEAQSKSKPRKVGEERSDLYSRTTTRHTRARAHAVSGEGSARGKWRVRALDLQGNACTREQKAGGLWSAAGGRALCLSRGQPTR